jgi:hypothetical protein
MQAKLTSQEYAALAQNGLKRLKEMEASEKWTANGEKPCKMFKCEVGDRVASKGIDKVKFNIEKVFKYLEEETTLKKISPMLLEIKVLEVHEDYRINYMQYKGIWPVDNREFINVSAKEKTESKIYIATCGCPLDYPASKGVVRGEVFVGGYIIEKIDENTTQITYVSDADLKGSIPGMVKNTLSAKQGEIASKIGPSMEKDGIQ